VYLQVLQILPAVRLIIVALQLIIAALQAAVVHTLEAVLVVAVVAVEDPVVRAEAAQVVEVEDNSKII